MDETPKTAAPETENAGTNNPTEPQAPATEPTQQPEAPADGGLGLTAEQAADLKKFMESNGGYDKMMKNVKSAISNPQKLEEPQKTEEPQKPEEPVQPQTQPTYTEPAKPAKGYKTPQEFIVEEYYKSLAKEDKYKQIAGDITSGKILNEMAEFGIFPTDANGNLNDSQVRKFLDLKAQTVPAQQQVVEPTTTPTADYVQVGEQITTIEEAQKVMLDNIDKTGKGFAPHPQVEAAKEFLKKALAQQYN